ncbi:MAG: IS110 family transposase [Bacteroidia bacterium]
MAKKILSVKRPHCAGIDVGSERVFSCGPDLAVKNYGTTTGAFRILIAELKALGTTSVALESTGVYSLVLFDMLREAGFEVFLVNPKYTKSRAGKKTDVADCQWIQQLHQLDLLEPSFIPESWVLEMRQYARCRENLIQDGAKEVNRMRAALIQMNIRLDTVLSQVHGVSGMKMIRAILEGERDPETLLSLCQGRIKKNKSEQVKQALEGFYQPQHLFKLKQAVDRWDFINAQLDECDQYIERLLEQITQTMEEPKNLDKPKAMHHNKPNIKKLQAYNVMLAGGKNLTSIPGLNDHTVMRIIAEVGTDLSAFPSEKHFASWAGLTPGRNQSGKSNRRSRHNPKPPINQIFRQAAHSLLNSKNHALGAFGRRIRSRKGPQIAIKALARKLAVIFYRAMTKGIEYVEKGIETYQKNYEELKLKYLQKQAEKLGFSLNKVPSSDLKE